MPYKLIPPGKRRNAHYLIRGTIAGERIEVSTGCGPGQKPQAQAWAADYVARLEGQRVPGAGEIVAFSRACELYKAATPHLSKVDIRRIDAVGAHFNTTPCHELGHADLVAAAEVLMPGRAPATMNRKVMTPAAAVLHYAADSKWCSYQRIKKFKVSGKSNREPARDEDVALLIANVEAPPRVRKFGRKADYNVAYKRVFLLMLYELGLRISHLLSVQVPHFDLQAGRVKVKIPKSDDYANLEISPMVVAEIANILAETDAQQPRRALGRRVPREGRFFPWTTNRGVYAWLGPLTDRLGVTYTPHMSRHALATAAQDIPDKKAAELGVWKDPRSLHRYQHVKPEAIPGRSAATLLDSAKKRTA
ncbi:MAG: site-specific integrase [Reyranella sp.]|nr:site-specific integrase [Reyranella sp.]